ncbi:MAG: hypothetical protein PHI85_05745 [Victivallaceae bacterium]|nr:hypothetical protein [Victivallaceae bacterium]
MEKHFFNISTGARRLILIFRLQFRDFAANYIYGGIGSSAIQVLLRRLISGVSQRMAMLLKRSGSRSARYYLNRIRENRVPAQHQAAVAVD